jgi:hypothetical protein
MGDVACARAIPCAASETTAYRGVMADRDEFGYPLTNVTEEPFHSPVVLPADATDEDLRRHAGVYYLYLTRFRREHMAKVRARRRGQG